MGLLDGEGAGVLMSVMRSFYLSGTIYRTTLDYSGGDPIAAETEIAARVQFDALTERQRGQEGASDRDVRVLVLAEDGVALDTDCGVSVSSGPYAGARYAVMDVTRDPVGAYFDCRARREG